MEGKTIEITGPYFEDFKNGQIMEPPPSVTLTPGHVVFHQSLFGDRLRLSLDRELTGRATSIMPESGGQ